jgi:hypothetical protein
MENIKQSSFFPVSPLEGKNNYKVFYRIEEDATVSEHVFLDISDPRKRELLICLHYLKHISRCFLNENIGVNIVSRNCPWDFKLELSTGANFNLEITSVADRTDHFIINKREERFAKWISEDTIPLHELEKLSLLFLDAKLQNTVECFFKSGLQKTQLVDNPLKDGSPNIFLSNMPKPDETLSDIIRSSIDKKSIKGHLEKENTILIVDNRTSAFSVSDYISAAESLETFLKLLPFPEIWFYTGYFSDDDGNNAEFSLAPLKITEEQERIIDDLSTNSSIDENNRLVL